MTEIPPTPTLSQAYTACRAIARREAKNFYYAFIALTPQRRNAICAVYAFMRQADDLSDDESISRTERRANLDAWLSEWRSVLAGGSSSNPAFVATRDAAARYRIPLSLFDELVAGVSMDLDSAPTGAPDTYATFSDLYRYCYLVASVVGLVCIRIFGYSDTAAEKLAEETGIAFQLTNILRDVAEDASRSRVYLAIEDLTAHGLTAEELLQRAPSASPTTNERKLLADYTARAEDYYKSAQKLLPLIDRESRPALSVLVAIYHSLLHRIERADYDVFSSRASVPTAQKIVILMAGLAKMTWIRIFGRRSA